MTTTIGLKAYMMTASPIAVTTLDIDRYTTLLEDVMLRYTSYASGVVYVKGLRFPLESRCDIMEYSKYGNCSDKPWHPYLCIPMLLDILENIQYMYTDQAELFMYNPITNEGCVYNTTPNDTELDILRNYIPGISDDDIETALLAIRGIHNNIMHDIYVANPNNIYVLDISTSVYKLKMYATIKEYRFDEVVSNVDKHE